MLITPGGKPASRASSPSRNADSGVCSAGLSTTVQPAASAGASFHDASISGTFQGMMAPTTPTGSLTVYPKHSDPGNGATMSAVVPKILPGPQPPMLRIAPAAPITLRLRATNPSMPLSTVSICPSSSAFCSTRSASRHSRRSRASGAIPRQDGSSNALRAAATAASTSAGPASATRATSFPDEGSVTANVAPDSAGTHSPPIRRRRSVSR